MQTKLENLYKAAKAIGIPCTLSDVSETGVSIWRNNENYCWNPLTNAADLWELIVKLRLVIDFEHGYVTSRHGMHAFDIRDEMSARLAVLSMAVSFGY